MGKEQEFLVLVLDPYYGINDTKIFLIPCILQQSFGVIVIGIIEFYF